MIHDVYQIINSTGDPIYILQTFHFCFKQYIGPEHRLQGSGAAMARFGQSVASPGDIDKDGFNGKAKEKIS
jgi:hypothetical protein